MDGEVDGAFEKRDVELLRKKPLATRFRERPILDGVARGLDDLQGQVLHVPAMGGHQPVLRLMGLRQRQGAAARADDQGR
jgi:hypothetical protein